MNKVQYHGWDGLLRMEVEYKEAWIGQMTGETQGQQMIREADDLEEQMHKVLDDDDEGLWMIADRMIDTIRTRAERSQRTPQQLRPARHAIQRLMPKQGGGCRSTVMRR